MKYGIFRCDTRKWVEKLFFTVHGAIGYAKANHIISYGVYNPDILNMIDMSIFYWPRN
jgi:hypothetical protein